MRVRVYVCCVLCVVFFLYDVIDVCNLIEC